MLELSAEIVQKKVMAKISSAAQQGDVEEVARLLQLAKKIEAVIKEEQTSVKQIDEELEQANPLVNSLKVETNPKPLHMPIQTALSFKERGKLARTKWANARKAEGVSLIHKKGQIFQTAAGLTVGVAFACEHKSRPGKFFLGLPDQKFDAVVLLCELESGKVIDAALSTGFLVGIWKKLSRSKDQVKFNLRGSDAGLQIHLTGEGWENISAFIGSYKFLKN